VSFYGAQRTVGDVLRLMRCSSGCGGRVGAAWLVTGPILNARARPRRVALLGPETRNSDVDQATRAAARGTCPITFEKCNSRK
jgi:hypothetical protein